MLPPPIKTTWGGFGWWLFVGVILAFYRG